MASIETGMLAADPVPVAFLVDLDKNAFTCAQGRNPLAIEIETNIPLAMADHGQVIRSPDTGPA